MSIRIECPTRRRAAAAVLVVVSLPFIMGMAALTIDVGIMYNTRADLQNAADAAALGAINVLARGDKYVDARAAAIETAMDLVHRNTVMGHVVTIDPATDVIFGRAAYDEIANKYNFTPAGLPTNAVRVSVRHTEDSPNGPAPLYFAGIFGKTATNISAQASTMFIQTRYDEQDCGYVPAADEVVLCAPVGSCGDSTDSDGGAGAGKTECFKSDSESGGKGPGSKHTIAVDAGAALGYLAIGATPGPCPCIPGDIDDSDDSEGGDSDDSDDSGGGAVSNKVKICHVSASNPSNTFVRIVTPGVELDGHLAHGDTLGNCPGLGTLRVLLIE